VVHYDGSSLVVERRSTEQHARITAAAAQRPKMVVEHNVIYLSRQPASVAPKRVAAAAPVPVRKAPQPTRVAATGTEDSSIPVWRQGGGGALSVVHENHTVMQPVTPPVSQVTTVAIAPSYATRDPAPIGGETAINPNPPEIAYAQGAAGTTVFEVMIDERGNPTKCTITKSSGFLALDKSVCDAAMNAHYTPQTVSGKAQPGVYRDAFTFRDNGGD
jgi:TonB family protein